MVIQDTHLFTGTIADNIRYGRLDASREEIIEPPRWPMPTPLSAVFPRAMTRPCTATGPTYPRAAAASLHRPGGHLRPPVLILDEATSSIDTRTEKLIEQGMDALMEDRTVFVIAHRLSTVRNSKAIMVLEKGAS